MANTDRPNGFKPVVEGSSFFPPTRHRVAGAEAIAVGDMVEVDANGRIVLATATSDSLMGVAASAVTAAAAADDEIWIYDNPNQVFEGQCSGTMTNALMGSTRAAAASVDIEGTTGIQEIDENASVRDLIIPLETGFDPVSGNRSTLGAANARIRFRINPAQHNNWGNID